MFEKINNFYDFLSTRILSPNFKIQLTDRVF